MLVDLVDLMLLRGLFWLLGLPLRFTAFVLRGLWRLATVALRIVPKLVGA